MSAELRPRHCPVCGSTDDSHVVADTTIDATQWNRLSFSSRKLPEFVHHRMVECPVCDLVYASPAPDPEALEQAYRAAPFVSHEESVFAARTYRGLLRSLLDRLPNRSRALDIGASDGSFLQALLDEGFTDVVGIEPAAASAEAASGGIRTRIRVEPFRYETLADRRFDLITCFQTLEHVSDPARVVGDAFELLVVGGAILIVVHDRRALFARLIGRRSPIYDVEHLQLYSPRSIKELLQRAGFQEIHVARLTNRYPFRYWFRLAPIPGATVKRTFLTWLEHSRIGGIPVSFRPGNLAVSGRRRAP